jgi:Fe-S cluster biogenesis protein NfuA
MHAAALRTLTGHLRGEGLDSCAGDELVASVLLLHDLHPWPLERRLEHALDRVRPMLEERGGGIELLGAELPLVEVRVQGGSACGCGSTSARLRAMIENSVRDMAPDVAEIRIQGLDAAGAEGFVVLTVDQDGVLEERSAP